MWDKDDWDQFFDISQRRWQRRLPPRPVAPIGANRTLPVVGFSLSELDDAGINVQVAERLGLPVDGARIGAYSANVSTLRDFVRLARQPKWGQ
jgi:ribosomal protein L13E